MSYSIFTCVCVGVKMKNEVREVYLYTAAFLLKYCVTFSVTYVPEFPLVVSS